MIKVFDRIKRPLAATTLAVFLGVGGLLSGCATPPPPSDKELVKEYNQVNDPAEPTNRAIWEFNRALDTLLLKPAAVAYRDLTPPPFQRRVRNVLNNLRSPIIFLNDIMQGEVERAGVTMVRFIINSTVGILGLGDPASDMGYAFHDEDFGQTLAAWGFDEGPFVMLPVLGPSNPRDAVGTVVDWFIDPFAVWARNTERDALIYARAGVDAVDTRAGLIDTLDDLEKSSLDYYAAIRSLYRQRRTDLIRNGEGDPKRKSPQVNRAPMDIDDMPGIDSGDVDEEISTKK